MANIFDLFKKIESQKTPPAPITFIVAGLGNPGAEYDRTRHNAGFAAIDLLADSLNVTVNRARFDALTADAVIGGKRVLLMKPQLYMNQSGVSIAKAADFYRIPPENIIVISDDINLEVGRLRIRRSGSDGGQKGLRSIIKSLGTEAFPRIRLGVGKVPAGGDVVSWVLGKIPSDLRDSFRTTAEQVRQIVPLLLEGNYDKAMCEFNR